MKAIVPLLVLAALTLSAPAGAWADDRHHDRAGGGEWRGGGPGGPYGSRGPYSSAPGGPGGPGGRPYGPYEGGPSSPQGRWGDGRYTPPANLPAEQQRGRVNSLGEGWREQQNEAREGVRRGELRPLGGVLSELRRRQPGHELDVGMEQDPAGRPVYRVRWAAANGRRIDFIVDARTGAVLQEEGR